MADIKDYGKAATDLQQNETYNQVSQPPNYDQSEAYAAQQPPYTEQQAALYSGQQETPYPGQQGAPYPGQHATPYPERPASSYPNQQASLYHGKQTSQYPEQHTENQPNFYPGQPATTYSGQKVQHPEKQTAPYASQYAQYPASRQPLQPSYQVVQKVSTTMEHVKIHLTLSVIKFLCWYWSPGLMPTLIQIYGFCLPGPIVIIMWGMASLETCRDGLWMVRRQSLKKQMLRQHFGLERRELQTDGRHKGAKGDNSGQH